MSFTDDLFGGSFDPTWGSVTGIDYDPSSGQSFEDWVSGQGDMASEYDIDFAGASEGYTAPGGINLHELTLQQYSVAENLDDPNDWFDAFMGDGSTQSLMGVMAISGFLDEMPGLDDDGGFVWTDENRPDVSEISAMRNFIEEQASQFQYLAGGPQLGDAESGLIGEYELKEAQAHETFDTFMSAYGREGQMGEDIAALEGKYDEALESANLEKRASLDAINRAESAQRQATVEGLVSAGRGAGKGVRGSGSKRMNVMLDSQLAALRGLKDQSKFARETASEAIEYAGRQFGTWEGGVQTGEMGLREEALQRNFNAMGMFQANTLQNDLELIQAEFDTLVASEYDDWYADISTRMSGLTGVKFGDDYLNDTFNAFGSSDDSTDGGTDGGTSTTDDSTDGGTDGGTDNDDDKLPGWDNADGNNNEYGGCEPGQHEDMSGGCSPDDPFNPYA